MAQTIKTAIFGNGFARTVILPCLRRVDGVSVVGIASPDRGRREATAAEFGIPMHSADHREVLEQTRPDLVFVAVPPDRHAEMSIDALEAGCHVVCEKPMALSTNESRRMLGAARSHPDRLALINHELRFRPERVALHDKLREGSLGRILQADYCLHGTARWDPSLPWTWWSDAERGGGALGAIGSHAVDALVWMLGEVTEVQGTLATLVSERRDPATGELRRVTADDGCTATMHLASGTWATLQVSTVLGRRLHRLSVAGTKGAACLLEQQAPAVARARKGSPGEFSWEEMAVADDLPPSSELGIQNTDWARSFLRFARGLAAALGNGESTMPGAADFEDGHRTQAVLDAIRRSSRSGRWEEPERD